MALLERFLGTTYDSAPFRPDRTYSAPSPSLSVLLSVVIPVYNEADRLRETVRDVARHVETLSPGDVEILCCDDGSTDASAAIVTELAAHLPVRLLRAPVNRGKGDAVRRGMLAARGEIVFFFDADLSTPLAEMQGFIDRLGAGADVVIGTRKHPEARIDRYQPWYRVQLGLAYTRLVNGLMGLRFSDYTCGFKAWRREAALAVFERSRLSGWSFDAEAVFLAARLGYQIVEIPVQWADRPDTRVRLGRAIGQSLLELLAVRYHHLRGSYRLDGTRRPPA